ALAQQLFRAQSQQFDRLVAAVTDEYKQEERLRASSARDRGLDSVRRLLRYEAIDPTGLAYDFDAWHVAVIAPDPATATDLRRLSKELDRRLLVVEPEPAALWGWFGGRRPLDSDRIAERARRQWPPSSRLSIGEPARGLRGWRLSHRQTEAL